jgi:hypothetical protein
MERRIVEIGDGVWIYLPRGLTPEQETKVIAHYLFNFEPDVMEAKCKEWLRQHAEQYGAPLEPVFAELERLAYSQVS